MMEGGCRAEVSGRARARCGDVSGARLARLELVAVPTYAYSYSYLHVVAVPVLVTARERSRHHVHRVVASKVALLRRPVFGVVTHPLRHAGSTQRTRSSAAGSHPAGTSRSSRIINMRSRGGETTGQPTCPKPAISSPSTHGRPRARRLANLPARAACRYCDSTWPRGSRKKMTLTRDACTNGAWHCSAPPTGLTCGEKTAWARRCTPRPTRSARRRGVGDGKSGSSVCRARGD